MTQKAQIKKLLEDGYHLTKLQILRKVGCWNSGDCIMKLRNEGMPIKTRMEKHYITGKRYAVYYV